LTRAAGRDKQHLDEALERLEEAGQIDVETFDRGLKYKATEVKP
jgi:predicted transcriptional regulator